MAAQQKSLNLIQMLRGIACLLVVLLHITINYSEAFGAPFLRNIFTFGGSGVDIFFVLSGFIITYSSNTSLHQQSQPVAAFIKRRGIRIFPIYWIWTTFFLLLQVIFHPFYKTHFVFDLPNLVKTYLLLPGHSMVNGVSWSLTNELFFYLLFALAIVIGNKRYVAVMGVSYFLLLLYLGLFVKMDPSQNAYLQLMLFPMNIEFLLGVSICLMAERVSDKWTYALLVAGILLFTAGAFYTANNPQLLNYGMDRVVFFGFPSFLIVLAIVKLETSRTVSVGNVFLKLGDASYSIYLIHLPFVAAFCKIVATLNIENGFLLHVLCLLLFIGICWLGIVTFNKVEKPVIKRLNKLFLRSKTQ